MDIQRISILDMAITVLVFVIVNIAPFSSSFLSETECNIIIVSVIRVSYFLQFLFYFAGSTF